MSDRDFRDELLGLQQANPELQAQCDRRIREMMEVELRPIQRAVLFATASVGVLFFLGFAWAAIWAIGRFSWQVPAMFAVGSLLGAAWSLLAVRALRRGRLTRGREWISSSVLVWLFAVAQFMLFFGLGTQANAKHAYQGTWMILFSLFFVIAGAANLIMTKIDQSSAQTEEQILRLQLRMEQLASGKGSKQSQ